MKQFFKTLSIAPRSIRRKLIVAFALMSLIPMFVFGYLIYYYIFPTVNTFGEVYLIFIITIFIMLLGFYLAKTIIYPIIEITAHAKGISEGKYEQGPEIKTEDEIGELSGSLNRLSSRLKENMSQLHSYGEKIKQINMEINRKVFALSSLLQIGNLITTTTKLEEIFPLIIEKLSQLQADGAAFLMLYDKDSNELTMRAHANIQDELIQQHQERIGRELLNTVVRTIHPLIVDAQKIAKGFSKKMLEILSIKNILVLPVISSGEAVGILAATNKKEQFLYTNDEIELVGVFAKQVAVAIENAQLTHKTKELTVRDELTGLYNERYIRTRLDEEIKRAVSYQRPCSFIIFAIENFKQYCESLGKIAGEKALKKVAQILKGSTTDIDKVARLSEQQFALILPEKNKRQSLTLAKNVMKEIEKYNIGQKNLKPFVPLNLKGGICATPIDGMNARELINKALAYLGQAKGEGFIEGEKNG